MEYEEDDYDITNIPQEDRRVEQMYEFFYNNQLQFLDEYLQENRDLVVPLDIWYDTIVRNDIPFLIRLLKHNIPAMIDELKAESDRLGHEEISRLLFVYPRLAYLYRRFVELSKQHKSQKEELELQHIVNTLAMYIDLLPEEPRSVIAYYLVERETTNAVPGRFVTELSGFLGGSGKRKHRKSKTFRRKSTLK